LGFLLALLRTMCFPAGTPVAAVDGAKPIEAIREGDLVYAQSDQTGEIMLKRVKQVFQSVAAALVVLHCGTNTLAATPEHPLWVFGGSKCLFQGYCVSPRVTRRKTSSRPISSSRSSMSFAPPRASTSATML
jgi:hypothetical protein